MSIPFFFNDVTSCLIIATTTNQVQQPRLAFLGEGSSERAIEQHAWVSVLEVS